MAYLFTKTDALIVYRIQQRMRLRPSVDCMKMKKEKIWLATSSGIYYYESGEMTLVADDDVVAPDVTAISGYRSYVYAIVNNDTIVNIKDDQIVSKISKMEYTEEDLNNLFCR